MNFKDLLRLLRRRWLLAVCATALTLTGILAYTFVSERPVYRARAQVRIATPGYLMPAQSSPYVSTPSILDPRTWLSLIAGAKVRKAAKDLLAAEKPPAPPGAIDAVDTVTTVADASTELFWLETTGPTREAAAAAANALAQAAQSEGFLKANEQAMGMIASTGEVRDREAGFQRAEAETARRTRETARIRAGSENLELDVRKLQEDLLTHETRRRELDRTIRANRFRLERVRADRAAAEHFIRETVPRLGTASIQARVAENARVKAVGERLESLHRELLLLRRKYTEEHPQVRDVRQNLLETEVELTRSQIQAVGFDMDKEELDLRAKNELIAIELRVLEPELRDIKSRLETLTPFLDTAKTHEAKSIEIGARVQTLATLFNQLESTGREKGYVHREQPAIPGEASLVAPRLAKSWFVFLLISIVFGISIAFLRDFMDTSVRTDFDVRRHLDYPVLAVIPRVASADIRALWRTGPVSEMFDTLGTVLLSLPAERACRVLLVTSTNPEEGKTAVSTNLAVALARQGKRTLLIDADMRLPSIHAIMGLENTLGLADVLSGSSPVGTPGLLQEIEGTHLKVLPSGVPPENPYELLDPGRVTALLAPFRDQFDVVVIDTPPVLRAGDALKLSSVADQTLFVVESGKTDVRQATWAKRLLANVSARVAGVVLNRAAEESEEYYYYRGTREPVAGESRRESRRL